MDVNTQYTTQVSPSGAHISLSASELTALTSELMALVNPTPTLALLLTTVQTFNALNGQQPAKTGSLPT